jgi:nitroreductase
MNDIKKAITSTPVLEVIKHRWSARSFSDKALTTETMNTLFEAASWAASANNEQPWQYTYALKGTPGFDRLLHCLAPPNQIWAKGAGVLIAAIARKTYQVNGKENGWAVHDLGMANAHLFLQATSMGLYGHPMAGFDKVKLSETLELSDDQAPVCIIALGYLGNADQLEEPFKSRELTARTRKPVSEFVTGL